MWELTGNAFSFSRPLPCRGLRAYGAFYSFNLCFRVVGWKRVRENLCLWMFYKINTVGSQIFQALLPLGKVQSPVKNFFLTFCMGNVLFVISGSQGFSIINLQELINIKCSNQTLFNISNHVLNLGVALWSWNQGSHTSTGVGCYFWASKKKIMQAPTKEVIND